MSITRAGILLLVHFLGLGIGGVVGWHLNYYDPRVELEQIRQELSIIRWNGQVRDYNHIIWRESTKESLRNASIPWTEVDRVRGGEGDSQASHTE